jgi:hypothetical protein
MLGGFQVFVSGVALVAVTLAGASTAAAQQPAAPAEPTKPVLLLDEGDVALISIFIKADKTADFEVVTQQTERRVGEEREAGAEAAGGGLEGVQGTQPDRKTASRLCDANRSGRQGAGIRHQPDHRLKCSPVEVQELFAK